MNNNELILQIEKDLALLIESMKEINKDTLQKIESIKEQLGYKSFNCSYCKDDKEKHCYECHGDCRCFDPEG